jgi:UDP-glucose 4-epimerase
MRVLVTGGAGYIGSHTLLELVAQGHEVMVFDDYSNAKPEVLARVRSLSNQNIPEVRGDIRDGAALNQVMSDFMPDAVIHFAGLKAVGESMQEPLRYYDVNVSGTGALLQAMDRAGVRRIIFSSSATVYGEPTYLPCDEEHPLNPSSVYGRTKLMAEQMIADWVATSPDKTGALLRYFNPAGAHLSTRIGEDPVGTPNNLIPFIAQVAVGKREALSIFGDDYDTPDGTGLRDYIHVVDLASAHAAAVNWVGANTGTRPFNIGTGQAYSVREMVTAFAKASGLEIACNVTPRRAGDIASIYADVSRANTELGWKASHGLADMCASSWGWQKANPSGYSDT